MDIKTLIVAALLAGLAGCQGSPAEIGMRSGAALEATPDREVVSAYGYSKSGLGENSKLRDEIERRALFTPEQWERIKAGQIRVGDHERVVWSAWGAPKSVHDLTTAAGRGRVLYYETNRVYLHDDVVTAIGSGR
jgi:hypothetical protein